MDKAGVQRMEMPGFIFERVDSHRGEVCELPLCIPAGEATHRAIFPDGVEVLVCDRHAVGIVALGVYLNHGPIVLDPLK